MNEAIAGFILMAGFTACNSDTTTSTTTTDSSSTAKSMDTGTGENKMTDNQMPTTPPATSKMPLSKGDSMFVMKAAAGGMMEVQGGNTAQQNAESGRVKNFGAMMVADHSKANSELMAIASSRGLTPPADLPADMKMHMNEMAKMKGKSFDSRYISMMIADHKEDIADFEKEASGGNDAEVKAFAAKTLPVLKMHLDSIQAISKRKM